MKFLREKIEPGCSLEDFLVAINSRVLFWPNRERLERLRNARQYRNQTQVIMHVDTRRLVGRHGGRIQFVPVQQWGDHSAQPSASKR